MNTTLLGKRVWAGIQALLFVVFTLGVWWGVASLTNNVARCVPEKLTSSACRPLARPLLDANGEPRRDKEGNLMYPPNALSARTENALLIISLFPALWIAHRLLYSEQDVEAKQPKEKAAKGPGSIHKAA